MKKLTFLLQSHISRFVGWWAGFAGLYAATGGQCPCCGAPACPNTIGVAGLLGAACALLAARVRRVAPGEAAQVDAQPSVPNSATSHQTG